MPRGRNATVRTECIIKHIVSDGADSVVNLV